MHGIYGQRASVIVGVTGCSQPRHRQSISRPCTLQLTLRTPPKTSSVRTGVQIDTRSDYDDGVRFAENKMG